MGQKTGWANKQHGWAKRKTGVPVPSRPTRTGTSFQVLVGGGQNQNNRRRRRRRRRRSEAPKAPIEGVGVWRRGVPSPKKIFADLSLKEAILKHFKMIISLLCFNTIVNIIKVLKTNFLKLYTEH